MSHKYTKSHLERIRQKIEYAQNRIVARLMADYFQDDVLLMPQLKSSECDIRYVWEFLNRGYKFKPKMADSLLINSNQFYEVKSYEGSYKREKMAKMMSKLIEQSDVGVLYINQDIPLQYIQKDFRTYVNSLIKNKTEFKMKQVFAVINGQLYKLY